MIDIITESSHNSTVLLIPNHKLSAKSETSRSPNRQFITSLDIRKIQFITTSNAFKISSTLEPILTTEFQNYYTSFLRIKIVSKTFY